MVLLTQARGLGLACREGDLERQQIGMAPRRELDFGDAVAAAPAGNRDQGNRRGSSGSVPAARSSPSEKPSPSSSNSVVFTGDGQPGALQSLFRPSQTWGAPGWTTADEVVKVVPLG